MAQASSNIELDVPADEVWKLIGGFWFAARLVAIHSKIRARGKEGARAIWQILMVVPSSSASWRLMRRDVAIPTAFCKRHFRSQTTTQPSKRWSSIPRSAQGWCGPGNSLQDLS